MSRRDGASTEILLWVLVKRVISMYKPAKFPR